LENSLQGGTGGDDILVQQEGPLESSKITSTLLSNYLLGISLLKNIIIKFSQPASFEQEFQLLIQNLQSFEESL